MTYEYASEDLGTDDHAFATAADIVQDAALAVAGRAAHGRAAPRPPVEGPARTGGLSGDTTRKDLIEWQSCPRRSYGRTQIGRAPSPRSTLLPLLISTSSNSAPRPAPDPSSTLTATHRSSGEMSPVT
jgi:hypothetical protein